MADATEMVERVARALALHDARGDESKIAGIYWAWINPAKAAIEAMREPTEEMIERGQGCLDCVPINRCEQQARQVWDGMIWVAGHGS